MTVPMSEKQTWRICNWCSFHMIPLRIDNIAGIILCMCPANERQCYTVTLSLIGWAHTHNVPCISVTLSLIGWVHTQNDPCTATTKLCTNFLYITIPDSKVHGANMGPTWVLSAPGEPHVGPMNLTIWDISHIYQPNSYKLYGDTLA